MWRLALVGPARLTAVTPSDRYPAEYVELMQKWGPGWLCGICELPDPASARFAFLQAQYRGRVDRERARGRWAQLTDEEVATCPVLGLHARGDAVLGLSSSRFMLLAANGQITHCAGMDNLIKLIAKSAHRDEPPQPLHYITEHARDELYEALIAGDEARADAAFAKVLVTDGPVEGLLAIAHHLVTEMEGELRATYVEQCLRAAKRHSARVDAIDIRKLTRSLGSPDLLAPLTALVERAGIFFEAPIDATEIALRERLEAGDEAARLVLADHLEARGDLEAADLARVEPLANASERGFVPPVGAKPLDANALVAEWIAAWRGEAIDGVTAAVAALHPQERQGYATLLSEKWAKQHPDETPRAWPYYVLALRGPYRATALAALVEGNVVEAVPFVMSCISSAEDDRERLALAEAFIALGGKPTADEIARFAPKLADGSEVAARILEKSAADDRVFEAYLASFGELHRYAIGAISKRRKEPRVREVLTAAFAREQAKVLSNGGKTVKYSAAYGAIASYLKKLGVAGMAEAHDRYKKWCRIADASLNPRSYDI